MNKKILFTLSIFVILLTTSCNNLLGGGYGKNELSFEIGSRVADSITDTLIQNNAITKETELTIDCELLRGETPVKKDSLKVQLNELCNSGFNLTNIPNGNNYFISLSVYYKNHLIYKALSDLIVLNEENEEVNINLSLKQNNSTINYKLNGGDFVPGQKVYKEYFITSKATFPEPVKAHYKFDGWYSSKNCAPETRITELGKSCFLGDVTLYAKWIKLDQVSTVTITPAGEKFDQGDTITLETSTQRAKIYYTTNGTDPTTASSLYDSSKKITITESMINNDDKVVINAIAVKEGLDNSDIASKTFTQNRYTITFDANGHGTAPGPIQNKLRNEVVPKPSDLTLDGFTFGGWYKEKECTTAWDFEKDLVTADITLYAKWTDWEKVADVTFSKTGAVDYKEKVKLNCGTADAEIHYAIDNGTYQTVSSPYEVTITKDSTIKAYATKAGMNNSKETTATYTIKTYTITFDAKGHGTAPGSISGKKKGEVIVLQELTETNFTFDGWFDGEGKVHDDTYKYTVNKDVTLTAKWIVLGGVTSVSFTPSQALGSDNAIDKGENIKLSCSTEGATISYTTDGSDPKTSETKREYTGIPIVIENDVTIRAYAEKSGQTSSGENKQTYKVKTYTVTFKDGGHGTAPNNISDLKRGNTITAAQLEITPTPNSGFEFKNWTDAEGTVISANHSITKDLVLTANWTDIAPGPVTNVTSSIVNGKVRLSWTNPVDADFDKVIITCTGTNINETVNKTADNPATSVDITIPDADCNKGSYEFVITAYDKADPTAMSSTVEKKLVTLPKITSISSIPNWDKNSNKTGYGITVTGTNMNVANITYACNISPEPVDFNFNLSVGSKTETTVPMTFNIPNAVGEYTVTIRCLGVLKTQTFKVGAYAVGDTVMSDGMIISSTDIAGYMKANPSSIAVAVIFRGADNTAGTSTSALGVGLKQNKSALSWTAGNTRPGYGKVIGIVCTPSATGVGAADAATFQGTTDGRNSWGYICELDKNAETYYPAFDWVNNYGTSTESGLSSTGYKDVWYMPSIAELCELYKKKDDVSTVLTAAGGTGIRTDYSYWSSSQNDSSDNYVWALSFSNGEIQSVGKMQNKYVCCIRAF